ncbi:AMP-binding protein [Phenylobacterium aquaticum]|uniref:AMP-binding protein n=1 Tax=Phenylobacterium aquaticum TaxID=1763816 RepID=UPI001F5D32C5|nr:AMP-binding protein [Phenylobacterium aquaticum]MCI3131313.1 AMP-binding protein [Phenylobacterium aquaticum]
MGEIISGERRLSSEDLNARASRAATGLASLGVKAGDLIAIYLRNDLPFLEATFAAGLLGAIRPRSTGTMPRPRRAICSRTPAHGRSSSTPT